VHKATTTVKQGRVKLNGGDQKKLKRPWKKFKGRRFERLTVMG
jgi:hypothetical protein